MMGNIYGFLGYYNHSRSNLEKAKRFYEKAIKAGTKKAPYLLAYGVLLLREGKFEKAKELFSAVLLNYSTKEQYKTMAKTNISLAYWKLGDIDTAVDMMEEVHIKYPSGQVYGSLGYLLIEKGDLERALEYNLEALDYDDDDPVVLDNLGQIYYKMGDIEKAKEYFEKAEEEKDDQAITLYYLGRIYSQQGNKELAKEKLEKALNCNITALSAVTREDIQEVLVNLE